VKEKAGIVEEKIMDSASRQCASSQLPRGEAVFSRQVHSGAQHPSTPIDWI
jgi:hypothetical protein